MRAATRRSSRSSCSPPTATTSQRRLERVAKQAKSGDTKLRAEVENLEQLAAHLENLQAVSELGGDVDIPRSSSC